MYKIREDVDLNILEEKYKFEHIPGMGYYKVYTPKLFWLLGNLYCKKIRGVSVHEDDRIIDIKKSTGFNMITMCDWISSTEDIFAIKDLIKAGIVEEVSSVNVK